MLSTLRLSLAVGVLCIVGASPATAQADPAFGDCPLGTASMDLNEADVRARMFNVGAFFWRGGSAQYEVPNGSGLTSIFAASLWLAGTVGGEIRSAWADFGDWEWRPGPLGPGGAAPTLESCAAADRIWRVTLDEIAAYNAGDEPATDLAEWPAGLGAPVIDGDGDPDNYDLAAGDRPAILGAETLWWVMNDRGNQHLNANTPPFGLELRVTAFSFPADYTLGRFGRPAATFAQDLALMTFYRLEFTNGNTTDAIDDLAVGWWTEMDLGNFDDDYVGSDPDLNLAYGYNADDDDDVSRGGYGDRPPAIGDVFLNETMAGFLYYDNSRDEVTGNPANGQEIYNYTHGLWRDGQPRTFGEDATNPDNPVWPFHFSDLPPTYWSESDASSEPGAQPTEPRDRRFMSNTLRDRLEPGETWTIDKAIVWSRTEQGGAGAALRSLDLLLANAERIQDVYDAVGLFEPDPNLLTVLPAGSEVVEPTFPSRLGLGQRPRPHPVTASSVIDVAVPEGVAASVQVFDALGRLVATMPLVAGQETVAVGALDLAPGSYLARLKAETQVDTRIVQFIVTR